MILKMEEEVFCKSISCVHKSINTMMIQSYGNILMNLLVWCEHRIVVALKFSTYFCKNSTNKLQWEVLKINPENDRKFCIEIDIPVTRILVYINYILSDFYYTRDFLVTNTTGRWTARCYWNCSINADPNIQYFAVFMLLLRLSVRLTQKHKFLQWFFFNKNSFLSSISYAYNIQPFLN